MYKYSNSIIIIIIIILAFFMVINPQASLEAARDGISLWYAVLLPALLPFFIVAELLVASGFVKFMGVVLEPVMRPIFRLPGCSSLVIVMGFTSGFPVGAILSRKLYEEGLLDGEETERLVSFTNNSSPLFIIGAVGAGLFGSPLLGYILAIAHYSSNLILGLLLRFRGNQEKTRSDVLRQLLNQAWAEMHDTIKSSGIGKLLTEAIKNSLNNIIAIAGFVIIFSVVTRMLLWWGIMDCIAQAFIHLLQFVHLPYSLAIGLGFGCFEISLGTRTVSLAPQGDLLFKLVAASSILAFSGLSIIAQITGIMTGTPFRARFYVLMRLLQILLSICITITVYMLLAGREILTAGRFSVNQVLYSFDAWSISLSCLAAGALFLVVMMIYSWLCSNS